MHQQNTSVRKSKTLHLHKAEVSCPPEHETAARLTWCEDRGLSLALLCGLSLVLQVLLLTLHLVSSAVHQRPAHQHRKPTHPQLLMAQQQNTQLLIGKYICPLNTSMPLASTANLHSDSNSCDKSHKTREEHKRHNDNTRRCMTDRQSEKILHALARQQG